MKYRAPFGSTDPDAHYVDRSTPNAIQGSKVPAKAVEDPQREIVAVIVAAGLTPGDSTTQLLEALQHFFAQFPIFPECLNSNDTFDVSSPSAGTIRVPAGIEWIMRGATRYATAANVDLSSLSSKTYHLRWDLANGFRLRNLADTGYNPGSLAETDPAFDSTYDDMLIARVVTNGSNVATITNLKNRNKFVKQANRRDALAQALDWTTLSGSGVALNWARTPDAVHLAMNEWASNNADPDGIAWASPQGRAVAVAARIPTGGTTRYAIAALEYYYEDDAGNLGTAGFNFLIMAL